MPKGPNRLLGALRGLHDLTQRDVAHALGVNVNRYWEIENGHGAPLTDAQRACLRAVFTVDDDALDAHGRVINAVNHALLAALLGPVPKTIARTHPSTTTTATVADL